MVKTSVDEVSKKSTSKIAIASLICGLCGFLLVGFLRIFAFIPAIVAIVLGFVANSEIKKDNSKKGGGLALTGIVIGIFTCLGLVGIIMIALEK